MSNLPQIADGINTDDAMRRHVIEQLRHKFNGNGHDATRAERESRPCHGDIDTSQNHGIALLTQAITMLQQDVANLQHVVSLQSVLMEEKDLAFEHLREDTSYRISALEAHVGTLLPANKLPIHRGLPAFHTIIKLHADYWCNPTAGQGECKHVIKVLVWLNDLYQHNKNGSIKPIYYWLYPANSDNFSPRPNEWLRDDLAQTLNDTDALVGCPTWKTKGTHMNRDDACILFSDQVLRFCNTNNEFIDMKADHKKPTKPDAKQNAPTHTWTWYKPT